MSTPGQQCTVSCKTRTYLNTRIAPEYSLSSRYIPISPCLVIGPAWIFSMSNLACSFGKSISEDKRIFKKKKVSKTLQNPGREGSNGARVQKRYLRIFRSSLPGRKRAGSRVSGLFVAMIILTLCRVSNPSIWFKSWKKPKLSFDSETASVKVLPSKVLPLRDAVMITWFLWIKWAVRQLFWAGRQENVRFMTVSRHLWACENASSL